jgi:hypothetical protein
MIGAARVCVVEALLVALATRAAELSVTLAVAVVVAQRCARVVVEVEHAELGVELEQLLERLLAGGVRRGHVSLAPVGIRCRWCACC